MPRAEDFDRAVVVGKAKEVFWQKGYEATSMQDLVDAMGLNRSSIYNSFGGKMDLYRESIRTYQRESNTYLREALLDGDPMESLELLFSQAIDDIISDTENKGCFNLSCRMEMAERDHAIKDWLKGAEEHNLDLFSGIIRSGQEKGSINKDRSAQEYALYLLSGFQGLRLSGILNKDRKQLAGIADTLLSQLR